MTDDEKKAAWKKYRELAAIAKENNERQKSKQQSQEDERKRREALEAALKKAKIDVYGCNSDVSIDIWKPNLTVSLRGKTPAEIIKLYRQIKKIVDG